MKNDLDFLLNKAYFFLKFRPRTEKEVYRYLLKKIKNTSFKIDDVVLTINKLKEQDLINDQKFIDFFVQSRLNQKPKGKRLIIQELKQKGVSEDLIDEYFSKNDLQEEKLIEKLIEKVIYRYQNLDFFEKKERLSRYLLTKGFSFEAIKKKVAEFLKKE